MAQVKRTCDNCRKEYQADERSLKRGWGLCCSKSCAAKKREKNKPTYNKKTVEENNIIRANWNNKRYESICFLSYNGADDDQWGDCEFGIHE